jgi:predicted nucleic acid-binding protein
MPLFIDTNVFLSFYHVSSDDLEELRKLIVLLKKPALELYVPAQVVDEHRRNRESKIAEAIKRLTEQRLNLQFPQICKDYPEYDVLRGLQEAYAENHASLLNKMREDIDGANLKADKVIGELFGLGKRIATSAEILAKARQRVDLGNPPGKNGSMGDAVSWEALLAQEVAQGDTLWFVSDDKDFRSPLDDESFNAFLLDEWQRKKKGPLVFYRRLSEFFKEHFPEIRFAIELEKDLLIQDLAGSGSFMTTHSCIAKLARYEDDFSTRQRNALLQAAVGNNQVYMIIDDEDLLSFYSRLIQGREAQLEPRRLAQVQSLMFPQLTQTPPEDDDVPF